MATGITVVTASGTPRFRSRVPPMATQTTSHRPVSAIIFACAGAIGCRGGSSLSRNTSTPQAIMIGVPDTTLPLLNPSLSSVSTRRSQSGNCRSSGGDSFHRGRRNHLHLPR
jgi:hypothetical protein